MSIDRTKRSVIDWLVSSGLLSVHQTNDLGDPDYKLTPAGWSTHFYLDQFIQSLDYDANLIAMLGDDE